MGLGVFRAWQLRSDISLLLLIAVQQLLLLVFLIVLRILLHCNLRASLVHEGGECEEEYEP